MLHIRRILSSLRRHPIVVLPLILVLGSIASVVWMFCASDRNAEVDPSAGAATSDSTPPSEAKAALEGIVQQYRFPVYDTESHGFGVDLEADRGPIRREEILDILRKLSATGHVRALRLGNGLTKEHWEVIGTFANLRALTVWYGKADFAQLARLSQLRDLMLVSAGSGIRNEDLNALTRLSHLRALRVIGTSDITDNGLATIAEMQSLRVLHFDCGPGPLITGKAQTITDDGIRYLARLENLTGLVLIENDLITDNAMQYVAQMQSLKELDVSYTAVTSAGLLKLSQLPRLRSVRVEHIEKPEGRDVVSAMPHVEFLWSPASR